MVLRCGTASHFTIVHLFTALCSRTCLACGLFRNFICLPTCSRCCFECIEKAPELSMISRSTATARYSVHESALKHLALSFYSLPGRYTIEQIQCNRRIGLVAEMDFRRALGLASTPGSLPRGTNLRKSNDVYTFTTTTTLPWNGRTRNVLQRMSRYTSQALVEVRHCH